MLGDAVRDKIRVWGNRTREEYCTEYQERTETEDGGLYLYLSDPTNIQEAEGSYAKRQDDMSEMIHAMRDTVGLEVDIG